MFILRYSSALFALALAAVLVGGSVGSADPGLTCSESGMCYKEVVKKHCVPTTEVHKRTKPCYDCKNVDVCLPKCTLCSFFSMFSLKKDCGPCCDDKCGKPHVKHVLIKKLETIEECRTKCEVECTSHLVPIKAPKCKSGQCLPGADCVEEVHLPAGEPIMAPALVPPVGK